MSFRTCEKCGTRMNTEGVKALAPDYCQTCHGPPPNGVGFQVNVMRNEEGSVWFVDLISPGGELLHRERAPNQEEARFRAGNMMQGVRMGIELLSALPPSIADKVAATIIEGITALQPAISAAKAKA